MIDNSLPDEPDNGANGQKLYIPSEGAAIGDVVECQVSGTVESLHGDVACVVPETVNGQPAPDAPMEETGESDHDKLYNQALRDDASDY